MSARNVTLPVLRLFGLTACGEEPIENAHGAWGAATRVVTASVERRQLVDDIQATGAGALSRQSIGAVVCFGVSCSAPPTLIVVPAVDGLLARNTHSPEYVSHLIDTLTASRA